MWLVLSLLGRWQRRTYNLTTAESGGNAAQPDFLKVDHDKRREALAKASPGEAVEPPPQRTRFARLAGYAATFFAVITLIVATLKAVTSLDEYTAMASEAATLVTDTDAMATAVRDYWPGILVAILVIVVQVGRVVLTLRKN
ncbi:MAG: hypothetical protein AAGF49_10895 [Pseudomonadota bacterium]